MCRNIKMLHNFDPPATDEEIYLSSVQFVRKLSGCTRPSKANAAAFDRAVDKVSRAARELIELACHRCAAPQPRERGAQSPRSLCRAFPQPSYDRVALIDPRETNQGPAEGHKSS